METIKQCPNQLNTLFFSKFNQSLLQRGIRQAFYNKYKVKIDYQDPDDILSLMRVMFIANMSNPYGNICAQVKFINGRVIDEALKQITTGVSQYYGYLNHLKEPIYPPSVPINTSIYGTKIDLNDQIVI
jgi:hypothetical protein